MADRSMYHQASRELQDIFDTRRLADRLESVLRHDRFTDADRAFIARQSMFFLATADPDGWPECSFKGGPPGFVRVVDDQTLEFPSYDGNGMFKSLGNVKANPRVGLLFISFEEPKRLRVNGMAELVTEAAVVAEFVGAQLVVRVRARDIFPNCPRYIPRTAIVEASPYLPVAGCEAPVPGWKRRPEFNQVLPAGDRAREDDRRQ